MPKYSHVISRRPAQQPVPQQDDAALATGRRLTAWRLAVDLNINDVCAAIGVTRNTLRKYEDGTTDPRASSLRALYDLGLNVNWLLTGEGSMFQPAAAGVANRFLDGVNLLLEATEEERARYRSMMMKLSEQG